MQACSKRRCKLKACGPCPFVFETAHRASSYQRPSPSEMSKFFKEAKKKVKKTAGLAVDLFRPSQPGSRAASPSPSQQSEHSATPITATEPQPPMPVALSAMAQPLIASTSVAILPSQHSSPTPDDVSSPSLQSNPPATPAYARPPSPTTILATTGSAVKGLLVAARDGSDLFLPLKTALVGVVAIWDIFDVRYSTPFVYSGSSYF